MSVLGMATGLAEIQVRIEYLSPAMEFLEGNLDRRTSVLSRDLPVTCTVARSEIWFASRLAVWARKSGQN